MPEMNLTHVEPEYAKKLFQFFDSQAKVGIKVWKKRTSYFFNDGVEFTLHHDMFQRDRKAGREGVRYELVSNDQPIAAGTYGKIKKIEATVALDEDKIRCKKRGENKTRVVKVQPHQEHYPESNVHKEYQLSVKANHLGIKKPTIFTNPDHRTESYMVMRHIPGVELLDIFNDDLEGVRVLSTKQRFELSIALLQALKDQVTSHGIVHRDLKIENIMVLMGSPIQVNIIDYGLSMDAAHPDGKQVGTPAYAAAEIFINPSSVDHKADVFSMARVIALLWHVNISTYMDDGNKGAPIYAADLFIEEMLDDIFNEINDLDGASKRDILKVLDGMLQHEHAKRLTLDEAIARFPKELSKVQAKSPIHAQQPAAASYSRGRFFVSESISYESLPALPDSIDPKAAEAASESVSEQMQSLAL